MAKVDGISTGDAFSGKCLPEKTRSTKAELPLHIQG